MDAVTLLLAAGGVVITIVGSNITLIGWLRGDMKSFENKIETKIETLKDEIKRDMSNHKDEIRRDMSNYKDEIRKDISNHKDEIRKDLALYKDEIQKEMRDFHGRLCTIEERHRDKS